MIRVADIQRIVAAHYEVPTEVMRWPWRGHRKMANPRHVAMYLSRELARRSYPVIAREFARKDHTTAIFAHRKIQRMMAESDAFAAEVLALEKLVATGDKSAVKPFCAASRAS